MNGRLIAGVAGGAVLVAAAVVGGAAYSGNQAKKQLQALPLALQTQWPMLKVVDQRYEKHLFSATHNVTLQIGCSPAAGAASGAPLLISFSQRIQHGPLPGFSSLAAAVIDTELVLPEAQRKALAELTGNQPPLTLHTVVGLSGTHHSRLSMPQFQVRGAKGEQFAWQGLQLDVDGSGSGFQYDLSLPGASMSARDDNMAMEMKFAGIKMRGEASGSGSLWLRPGKAEGELEAMEMAMSGPASQAQPLTQFALRKLKLSSDSAIDKAGLLSGTGRFTGAGSVGDVKLDKIEMQVSLKRLHAASYERLMQHMMDVSNTCDAQQAAVAPQMLLAQMQEDALALLPYNPEYSLDTLSLDIDGKHGEASYAVGVNGVSEAELKQQPLLALLMGKGQFRGHAKLPLAWVEGTVAKFGGQGDPAAQAELVNVMLTKMTGDGVVVREGDMLSTDFAYDKGQLTVNGKPMGRPAQ
ncbi:MAG TPA: YdgA family protein [Albitalea sp.]|nr:YdgA family protein [Albitalea sp.]